MPRDVKKILEDDARKPTAPGVEEPDDILMTTSRQNPQPMTRVKEKPNHLRMMKQRNCALN